MYVTCVRHRVKNYDQWKKAFEHNAFLLFKKFGVIDTKIVQIAGDSTDIAVINVWPSKKHWDDFGAAHALPEYKDKVKTPEEGGVIGDVQWWEGSVMD